MSEEYTDSFKIKCAEYLRELATKDIMDVHEKTILEATANMVLLQLEYRHLRPSE